MGADWPEVFSLTIQADLAWSDASPYSPHPRVHMSGFPTLELIVHGSGLA